MFVKENSDRKKIGIGKSIISTIYYNSSYKKYYQLLYYRDYKKVSDDLFRNDILQVQALTDTKENVQTNIVNAFNEHAPLKKRYVHTNQAPFMNKKLSKEIMTRIRLRNKL